MNKNLLIGLGIGLACVIGAVAAILYMQRGAHLELPGKFLKIRTAPLEDNASVAVIDLRISNTSDYPATIRRVTLYSEQKNGARLEGRTISQLDTKRVFEAIPLLGDQYNPTLADREQIAAHATVDRMIAARFEISETDLLSRKQFIASLEEIDGRSFEINEK